MYHEEGSYVREWEFGSICRSLAMRRVILLAWLSWRVRRVSGVRCPHAPRGVRYVECVRVDRVKKTGAPRAQKSGCLLLTTAFSCSFAEWAAAARRDPIRPY